MQLAALKKVVVTGGAGFLGRQVVAELIRRGVSEKSIVIPRSRTHDLRKFETCVALLEGGDLLIHLAAKVGGIGFNQRLPGELFFDNASMGMNLVEAARLQGIKKVVMAGTICSYPSHAPIPFREESLWDGYPEETNAPYGIAKKSVLVMMQSYRAQYGMNGVFLLPVNLYGPEDNFDPESSHVIPALIRKFHDAKVRGAKSVVLWGDGSPTREFVFVRDAARAIVMATETYDGGEPVNVGSSYEISIRDLAQLVKKKVGFEGVIEWDTSRPNGQERRKLDVSRAEKAFGFRSAITFDEGLDETIRWWEEVGSRR